MFPKPHAALIALSAPLIAALPVASQAAENPFDSLLAGTEVSAWAAGSYMHRLKESSDANLGTGYFSHPDAMQSIMLAVSSAVSCLVSLLPINPVFGRAPKNAFL